MILKASPEKGASSEQGRVSATSASSWEVPLTGGRSSGEGRYDTTASSRGWTPLFLKADPHRTGTKAPAMVPLRMRARRASTSGSTPSRYASIAASSWSTAASTSFSRHSAAWAAYSAGMSPVL